MTTKTERDEWLRLALELANLNRDAYRAFRADVWREIADGHSKKTTEELARWCRAAS